MEYDNDLDRVATIADVDHARAAAWITSTHALLLLVIALVRAGRLCRADLEPLLLHIDWVRDKFGPLAGRDAEYVTTELAELQALLGTQRGTGE